jgi:hypothetical protein
MRSAKILTAAVAIFLFQACAPAPAPEPAQPTDADRQALVDLMTAVETAYNAQDVAGMLATVADDYQGIGPDGTHTQGKAAYEANLVEEFAEPWPEGFALSIETGYVHFHGADAATVGGTYSVAGLPEGAPNTGSWIVVGTRVGEQWLTSNALVATFVPEEMPEG